MENKFFHRKSFFTLIEVLIAIGLVVVLLSTLLGIYSYIDRMHREIRISEQTNFRLLYAQYRLAEVLPNAIKKEKNPAKKQLDDFYFYMTSGIKKGTPSLVLTFDNGITIPRIFPIM